MSGHQNEGFYLDESPDAIKKGEQANASRVNEISNKLIEIIPLNLCFIT